MYGSCVSSMNEITIWKLHCDRVDLRVGMEGNKAWAKTRLFSQYEMKYLKKIPVAPCQKHFFLLYNLLCNMKSMYVLFTFHQGSIS